MKYIDAEKLKTEIERHIKDVKDAEKRFTPNMGFFDAKLSGIYDVLAIIDSLQQEQKPLEYLSKEKVFAIMNKLTSLSFCVPLGSDEEKKIHEITCDVSSLLDYPIEQKPLEWSEEDEKIQKDIIQVLKSYLLQADCDDSSLSGSYPTYYLAKSFRVAKDWLKSLPERFNLQPKPEQKPETKLTGWVARKEK